jgi:hypothetical protein
MRDEPDARAKVPKVFAHLDPMKGVGSYRQQDGGHGSRNPLRSV